MSEEDKIKHVARYVEACYLAEMFEVLFEQRCRELKVDPAIIAPADSPLLFLETARAPECGYRN